APLRRGRGDRRRGARRARDRASAQGEGATLALRRTRSWTTHDTPAEPSSAEERAHHGRERCRIFDLGIVAELGPGVEGGARDFPGEALTDREDRDRVALAPGDERGDIEPLERADPSM